MFSNLLFLPHALTFGLVTPDIYDSPHPTLVHPRQNVFQQLVYEIRRIFHPHPVISILSCFSRIGANCCVVSGHYLPRYLVAASKRRAIAERKGGGTVEPHFRAARTSSACVRACMRLRPLVLVSDLVFTVAAAVSARLIGWQTSELGKLNSSRLRPLVCRLFSSDLARPSSLHSRHV